MRTIVWLPIAALSLALAGCDKKEDAGTKGSPAVPAGSTAAAAATSAGTASPTTPANITRLDHPGTELGAKALIESFLKPDAKHEEMTQSLRPAAEDYAAIFEGDAATQARTRYDEQWGTGEYVIKAKDGQTEVLVWKATTEELRAGTGDSSSFPGGYKKVADKLKPGLTFYRFKYVKPGDKHGMAYDGLVYVNGHWVMVSKPYRAF